ncbi:MAG: hypothetical protein RRY52_04495, partial [Anaerovoracaceae bacterium]
MKSMLKKCGALVFTLVLVSGMTAYSFAVSVTDPYEIHTLKALKQELNMYEDSFSKVSIQKDVIKRTEPAVLEAYIQEKTEKAVTVLNEIDPDSILEENADGTLTGKKTVDLGDGCKVTVEFEDGEDKSPLTTIKDSIFSPVYAASNGEVMWKDYGNRYFTAKATILSGIGGCICSLENHYTLSANGIDERYGDAYENIGFSIGITGSVSHDNVIITDSTARTPGDSDVNMYVRFNWQYDGG